MNSASVEMSESDQYGQCHPKETREMIALKLMELGEELTKIAGANKTGYREAKTKCPDQLNDEFKLAFLRCEVFDAAKAAERLVKYWDKRLEIFGPDRAFLPLTQAGVFEGNEEAMETGMVTVLEGVRDPVGRSVLFYDPAKQDSKTFQRVQLVQCFWYATHAILEDVITQKKGAICMVCPRNAKITQFDGKLDMMIVESMKGCLPLRISCITICHPPPFFRAIWPIVQVFLGARLRKRVRLYGGNDEHVVRQVASLGLTPEDIPELIGGCLKVDHKRWLENRKNMAK